MVQDVVARRYALGEIAPAPSSCCRSTTPPPSPATIVELIALLGNDPDAFGERGRDLFDGLQDVAAREGRRQARDAERLLERVGEWVDEGGLDPGVGELARALLEPIAAADVDGDEDD